jgi:LacI family transcriptional regulator
LEGAAPTIKDVARRAGVSVATASNVVNGARPVGEASRKAVETAISELGYRVNRAAASLRSRQSRLAGMVVPDIANVFFAGMVDRVEQEAERAGYDLLIASSSEDPALERRRIEALIGRRVDGLIVAPSTDSSTDWCAEAASGALLPPMVLIDRGAEAAGFDTVSAAGEAGGYEATRHLIERGHRDIAVLAYGLEIGNVNARIAGYRRALAEAGLAGRERIVASAPGLENLRAAIEHDLHRVDRASAIFALTNHSSLAAIKAARGLGLDIPGDLSIVGFDDVDWMCALRPYLTTVAQPIEEIAARSWSLLMRRIGGDIGARQRIELPCTLKVRESTGFSRSPMKARAAAQT